MAKSKPNSNTVQQLINSFATIVKEIGLIGFLVVLVSGIFIIWATPEQKQAFIDLYILLKAPADGVNYQCWVIICFLIGIIVVTSIYSRLRNKQHELENKRIGKEKSELQELITKKKLKSSD